MPFTHPTLGPRPKGPTVALLSDGRGERSALLRIGSDAKVDAAIFFLSGFKLFI